MWGSGTMKLHSASVRSFLLCLLCGAIVTGGSAVFAQSGVLEEIKVTATKRGAASAQDLAMSITALSEDTLSAMGVQEFTDFSRAVAGLDVVDAGGPGQKRYLIRGLNLNGESPVGVYLDNIPLNGNGDDAAQFGGNMADVDLFDVERVEVLRGPQGTLYGANSVSGVVRILTNRPDATAFDAKVSADGAIKEDGDPDWGFKGMVNIPLVDDVLALRAVGYVVETGGFIDNIRLNKDPSCFAPQAPNPEITLIDGPGCNDGTSNLKDINSHRREGGRVSLQWNSAETTTVLLQGYYQSTESDDLNFTRPIEAINIGPPFVRPVRGGSNEFVTEAAGPRQTNVRSREPYDEDLWMAALELEHNFNWGVATLAGTYTKREADLRLDSSNPARLHRSFAAAGFPPPIMGAVISPTDHVNLFQAQDLESYSFEARLASQFAGRFNFLGGFFYEKLTRKLDSQGRITDPATGLDLPQDQIMALFTPAELARLASFPWPTDPFLITHRVANNQNEMVALFGEAYFNLTDQIELMGGLRFFNNRRTQNGAIIVPFLNSPALQGAGPGPEAGTVAKENDVLFKGQVTYKFREDKQVFFQIAEGYRTGGANPQLVSVIPPDFDSDQTLNLEVGAKTSWFNDRLIVNVSAFTIDWQDIQFEADFTQQFSGLLNCTEVDDPVRARGFDASFQALATDNLELGLNLAVMDAEWQVDANECISPELLATTLDGTLNQKKGDKLVGVPDYSGGAHAQYSFFDLPFGAQSGFIRADIMVQSKVPRNEDVLAQNLPNPSYVLANIRAGVDFGRYSVDFYIRNITDKAARFSLFQGFQRDNRVAPSQPRTIGLNVQYNFGG